MSQTINSLPNWAQTRVRDFVQNDKPPILGEKLPADQSYTDQFDGLIDQHLKMVKTNDNKQGVDKDPRDGFLDVKDQEGSFLSLPFRAAYEETQHGGSTALNVAEGQVAIFSHRTEEDAKIVILSLDGLGDDMAVNINYQNPAENYIILPDSLG